MQMINPSQSFFFFFHFSFSFPNRKDVHVGPYFYMGRGGALRNQKALDFLELELNGCKPPDVGCWEPNLGSSRRVASAPNGWAISSPMQFTV